MMRPFIWYAVVSATEIVLMRQPGHLVAEAPFAAVADHAAQPAYNRQ